MTGEAADRLALNTVKTVAVMPKHSGAVLCGEAPILSAQESSLGSQYLQPIDFENGTLLSNQIRSAAFGYNLVGSARSAQTSLAIDQFRRKINGLKG